MSEFSFEENQYFFLVIITACSSTKIFKYSALPKIVEGEGILLMKIKNLTENQQYKLFESAKKISEINELKFLPEWEYHLVNKGISMEHSYGNNISDSIIAIETNSRYILYVEDLNSKEGGEHFVLTPRWN